MLNQIKVKSVLNKHKKRDDWFLDDYSVNPYSGCSFNCIYCYVKGSKYRKNTTGRVTIKINAPEVLDRQLRRKAIKKEYGIIALGTTTEPYMPIEKKAKMTRRMLRIISRYRFPVEIATKSTLVLRDIDLLKEIEDKAILPRDLRTSLKRGVIISFSFSTIDEDLAKKVEPGAPDPNKRLEVMKQCKNEGFLTGACLIPVLPFLSDTEEKLEEMITTVKEFGADFVLVGGLTLYGNGPKDSKTLYFKFLEEHYPELIARYRKLYSHNATIREYYQRLQDRTEKLCKKIGIRNSIIP
ncbi:MAG: radical SAM protein [Candidatus Heimdallarchaeaceae archaeon]